MNPKTRKKIEAIIEEVAASEGDEFDAARHALALQTSDVHLELAIAAVVGAVRRRRRSNVLSIEREAVKSTTMHEFPGTSPSAMGIRKGSPAYWTWVRETPEGARYQVDEENLERRRWTCMNQIITEYESLLRVSWTRELLDSDFGLPDGTRVTWGAATIEQHEERAAMFERNAVANAEGAARHRLAIQELKRLGAPTLADATGHAA